MMVLWLLIILYTRYWCYRRHVLTNIPHANPVTDAPFQLKYRHHPIMWPRGGSRGNISPYPLRGGAAGVCGMPLLWEGLFSVSAGTVRRDSCRCVATPPGQVRTQSHWDKKKELRDAILQVTSHLSDYDPKLLSKDNYFYVHLMFSCAHL